jgi:hypothetical protein
VEEIAMQARLVKRRRLSLLMAGLFLGSVACGGSAASAISQTPSSTTQPTPTALATLTAADSAQLAQLEKRPLKLPPMSKGGTCPDGPHSTISPYQDSSNTVYVWGSAHVYVAGGPLRTGVRNNYFDVTYFTDPTITGVVLLRGREIGGTLKVVFVGDYAAGLVVGSDTIGDGTQGVLNAEAVLPAANPPVNASAASGWGIWNIRQGIDKTFNNCAGLQIDSASGSEVIVAAG